MKSVLVSNNMNGVGMDSICVDEQNREIAMVGRREIDIDCFAGGGGASLGIEWATGRPVDIAVNHDAEAIRMHEVNHPGTRHYPCDIWEVSPLEVARRNPIRLVWLSPDCTHFSKAKGGRPLRDPAARRSRAIAWIVIEWARKARPRMIFLENVEEFLGWCPLDASGRPDVTRWGETFRQWAQALRDAGYRLEWRELRACDYGSPTVRKRLFIIARRDGQPILWPTPTHGAQRTPYRTAAECIDWQRAAHSIFLDAKTARRVGCRRPLADATLKRIARGVHKYVLKSAEPFIIPITHRGDQRVHAIGEPLRTITCAHRGELALAGGRFEREAPGERVDRSESVATFLIRHFTSSTGQSIDAPAPTTTAGGGGHTGLVSALLSHQYGSNTCGGEGRLSVPARTVTARGQHAALIQAFMMRYYSGGGQWGRCDTPTPTVVTRGRVALVTVDRTLYRLTDIGMRMLQPRELFRAQGFPDSYVIDPMIAGKVLAKTAQIRMCGNSVCPQVAQAVVAANLKSDGLHMPRAA